MRSPLRRAALLTAVLTTLALTCAVQVAAHHRLVIGFGAFPSDLHPFISTSQTIGNLYLLPKSMKGPMPVRSTYVPTLWVEYWKPR